MRIVRPTRLAAEAAEALAPVRERVVVVGAVALDIALAGSHAVVTPTTDIDLVVQVDDAAAVVERLVSLDFEPSTLPWEAGFTWVRDELRVQLVRTFHPFPPAPADRFPGNPVYGIAQDPDHRDLVAFESEPERPRLTCVRPLALVALKEAAFGRVRGPDAAPVERDYHDVYLLLRHADESLAVDLPRASYEVRQRVRSALDRLGGEGTETVAAANQLVRTGETATQRDGELEVQRTARRVQRLLFPG